MKKITPYLLISSLVVIVIALWWPNLSLAQPENFDLSKGIVGNLSESCRLTGNCGWCDFVDLMVILQKVIFSLFGGLALIMFIWGGQGIIGAAGNQEKVAGAKKLLTSTLFGVVLILAGYFIINVVILILATPTGTLTPVTKLFSASTDWWKASCYGPEDKEFCQYHERGRICFKDSKTKGVCNNSICDPDTGREDFCKTMPVGTPCGDLKNNDSACAIDQTCTITCDSFSKSQPEDSFSCRSNNECDFTAAAYCSNGLTCCTPKSK